MNKKLNIIVFGTVRLFLVHKLNYVITCVSLIISFICFVQFEETVDQPNASDSSSSSAKAEVSKQDNVSSGEHLITKVKPSQMSLM